MADRAVRTVQITNPGGLDMPAATTFVELANRFACDVRIGKDAREVNGKSIMGVLMLVAAKGTTITITATGDDADAAAEALARLVADGFADGS